MTGLPIDPLLPDLRRTLASAGRAVLQAPPGAGKTTRVPLALLEDDPPGRILLLEPRRLAARAAAERLAAGLGEAPGGQVGYRMRGDSRPGRRIEVVTEGILTRMIQSDPELAGIGTLIFDEFHERSLDADLGLALALEVRTALRPDLRLLVMSATLDAGPVAALMDDAPILTAEGRSFPVTLRHLDRPRPRQERLEEGTAALVRQALAEADGDVLVFLPGEAEIRRTASRLGEAGGGTVIRPLYGAMPFRDQRAAIAPDPDGRRKVVLATSIAETSLTIEGIGAVVDAGRARRARFDPGTGMSALVTEKVTRAEAEQRAGRAGRLGPGTCYRLWTRGEEGALAPYPPAEIEAADLTGLALELAQWGAAELPFLTPPPDGAMAAARDLLQRLGALDAGGGITDHGRTLAAMPVHPRLGHLLAAGGARAADLAALLSDRDPMRGAGADLGARLRALAGDRTAVAAAPAALARIRAEAKRLRRQAGPGDHTPGQLAALAYPDRVGLRRPGDAPRYLLSGGRGAVLDPGDSLAGQRLLVATDLDGEGREARIRLALPLGEAELRQVHGDAIGWVETCRWSRRQGRVVARRQERFGAIVLDDRAWADAPDDALRQAMLDGVRQIGLTLSPGAARFRARVELARKGGAALPAMDDQSLLDSLDDWLLPHLTGLRTAADWKGFDTLPALRAMLDWEEAQALDAAVPAHFTTPLGRRVAIDYGGEEPEVSLRLQELFGQTSHPHVGGAPLKLVLLSPAGRPVQVTTDLPGFWASSYADVRKDMRGRYPKHPWPEDPTRADPTLRAKRKG